jgi:proteasome lid subunit RPN8/RPN11
MPRQIHRPPFRRRLRLSFAPRAWLKLMWFCHAGDTEVGGFGLTAPGRPLYVTDFLTLPQETTMVSVRFPDEAVADFFDRNIDRGLTPDRFARLWLHTHPGASAMPSMTDEDTFHSAFGACDWSIMAIVSRTGNTYARLKFAAGPGANIRLGVHVDWARWPEEMACPAVRLDTMIDDWIGEYAAHVHFPAMEVITQPADALGRDIAIDQRNGSAFTEFDHWNPNQSEEIAWPN